MAWEKSYFRLWWSCTKSSWTFSQRPAGSTVVAVWVVTVDIPRLAHTELGCSVLNGEERSLWSSLLSSRPTTHFSSQGPYNLQTTQTQPDRTLLASKAVKMGGDRWDLFICHTAGAVGACFTSGVVFTDQVRDAPETWCCEWHPQLCCWWLEGKSWWSWMLRWCELRRDRKKEL